MTRYAAVRGVRAVQVGSQWAVFSPLSGETHLLNNECAAILEVMQDLSEADTHAVADVLAADTGLALTDLCTEIDSVWPALVGSGVVRDITVQSLAAV